MTSEFRDVEINQESIVEEMAPVSQEHAPDKPEEDDGHRKWKCLFGFLVLAIIGTVIAASVVGTNQNKDDSSASSNTEPAPTAPPTPVPIDNPQEQFDILREALSANEFTVDYVQLLPEEAASLDGKFQDESEEVVVRAASWLIHKDPLNQENQLVSRFALTTLYLTMGGANWTDSTNWLSPYPACDLTNGWSGIVCDLLGAPTIKEIDLTSNNLEGSIPDTIALFTDLGALWLDGNNLTGKIPVQPLLSLPNLILVYLQGNNFTKPLPKNLPDKWVILKNVDETIQSGAHGQPNLAD